MPIIEDSHLVLRQDAVVGYSVPDVETRLAKTPRTVLARKYIVGSTFAIHVSLSCDVKYIAYKERNVVGRVRRWGARVCEYVL